MTEKVTSAAEQPQDFPDTLSGEVANTPAGQDALKDSQSDVMSGWYNNEDQCVSLLTC